MNEKFVYYLKVNEQGALKIIVPAIVGPQVLCLTNNNHLIRIASGVFYVVSKIVVLPRGLLLSLI